MADEEPKEQTAPAPVPTGRKPTVVTAQVVEKALTDVKPKKPGFFTRLFASFVHKTSPEVEPLEEQQRRLAREGGRPVSLQEAKAHERKGEELRKAAEMEALKSKLPERVVEERLLGRPEKMVEFTVPLKPLPPGAKPAQAPKPMEYLPATRGPMPQARMPTTPEESAKAAELLKAQAERFKTREEQTESEAILRELTGAAVEEAEVAEETGGRVHRRYLLKRKEAASHAGGVRVRASAETAKKAEFTELVQDVYTQLEATKSEGTLPQALGVKAPPKPIAGATPAAEAKPSSSFEDLLGLGKPASAPAKGAVPAGGVGSPLFSELAGIGGKPTSKPEVALVQVEAQKGMGCPTCHATNAKVIFCPYCATGMCANCSPKVTPKPDAIIYTCPSCGEEVTVKKKKP